MSVVNNEIYHELGEKWYHAHDDPVALLRAESRLRNPWVKQKIETLLGGDKSQIKILDVGCGAGFLSNYLAKETYHVQGIDLSEESLKVAEKYDTTKSVHYHFANAAHLPFKDNCFDVVTAMDFLEHVDQPDKIIAEISRVIRPGGVFFFHTFNRNFLSWLVIIKAVEIFVKNTPKDLHVLDHFVKPSELSKYCLNSRLEVKEMVGLAPMLFEKGVLWSFLHRTVPQNFSFQFTKSLKTSYSGYAVKVLHPELAK